MLPSLLGLALTAAAAAPVDAAAPTAAQVDAAAPTAAPSAEPVGAHHDLEVLYADGRYDELQRLARSRLAAHPDDVDLYWHLARALYEVGERVERTDRSVDKVALYTEMIDLADRGLSLRPGDPHLRFARGIANARLGTTRGVLSSLFLAKDIEADWLAVVGSGFRYASLDGNEVLPCDAMLALGIFYRLVPDWWIVQVLAGTRGDLDRSLDFLERADRCGPDRIGTLKELGATRLCIGVTRDDAAALSAGRAALRRVGELRPVGAIDRIDQAHAPRLLADPASACAYSRDGQQELDERKLKR